MKRNEGLGSHWGERGRSSLAPPTSTKVSQACKLDHCFLDREILSEPCIIGRRARWANPRTGDDRHCGPPPRIQLELRARQVVGILVFKKLEGAKTLLMSHCEVSAAKHAGQEGCRGGGKTRGICTVGTTLSHASCSSLPGEPKKEEIEACKRHACRVLCRG